MRTETGGLRRLYLRRRLNILKRVLIHVAALNQALLMRVVVGVGTPRTLQGRVCALFSRLVLLCRQLADVFSTGVVVSTTRQSAVLLSFATGVVRKLKRSKTTSTTGC
jgi:hypothetical protein